MIMPRPKGKAEKIAKQVMKDKGVRVGNEKNKKTSKDPALKDPYLQH